MSSSVEDSSDMGDIVPSQCTIPVDQANHQKDPAAFKSEKSLGSHHNEYHPSAATPVTVHVIGGNLEVALPVRHQEMVALSTIRGSYKIPTININENAAAKAILTLAGVEIQPRADGYIPMSFLKAGGKRYKHLSHDLKVKGRLSKLLDAEADRLAIVTRATSDDFSAKGLIEVNTKTNRYFMGYLHPRAALMIATQWFNQSIASEVADWYYRFLVGDTSLVADVVAASDRSNRTTTMATLTVADASVDGAILRDVHEKTSYQHCKAKRRTACMISRVSKRPRTDEILVTTCVLKETDILDRLWESVTTATDDSDEDDEDDCRSVYFLRSGATSAVKVGYSKDVCRRLRALQTGNEHLLGLEYFVATTKYVQLERQLHAFLRDQGLHIRGEWFQLVVGSDYADICRRAKSLSRTIKTL